MHYSLSNESAAASLSQCERMRNTLDGDEPKYTASFNLAELPQAIRALQLAQEYVESVEAEVQFA